MPTPKELSKGIVIVAVGFALMIVSFNAIIAAQKNIATGYMQSHCELLANANNVNDKWYECDE